MEIKIHRGIDQIGGCITEIASSSGARIIIDLGQNLPDGEGNVVDDLATKEAVAKLTDGVDAVLYTHYHGDHVGLSNLVPENVPQYIGKVAREVCICKHKRLSKIKGRKAQSLEEVATFEAMKFMTAGRYFKIEDIKITPYFVSHSAYESFMFLIEVDGKKVLHTGDYRDHSYIGGGLEKMLKAYVKQVDILITEGTMLSRNSEKVRSEQELQATFAQIMAEYKNVFVISSSTDLERLSTIKMAHREAKAKMPIVTDSFQKKIMSIFTENLKEKSALGLWDFGTIYDYRSTNSRLLAWMRNRGFTMFIRSNGKYNDWLNELLPKLKSSETVVIFSMWKEYVNEESKHAIQGYCDMYRRFDNRLTIHTSGHASKECIELVCKLTNPRLAIIPIHSERSAEFKNLNISADLKSKVVLKPTTIDDVVISI